MKELIKVPHPIEHQGLWVLRLDRFVLLHHGRIRLALLRDVFACFAAVLFHTAVGCGVQDARRLMGQHKAR